MPRPDNNAGSWLASELLTDVRQKARIPAGTVDYTDSILLEEATRAIWSFAGWAMSKSGDGRLLSLLTRASSQFLNGPYGTQREFDLPWDAVGDTFDSVTWVNGGSLTLGTSGTETRLELIPVSEQPLYDTATSQSDTPWGYAIVGGRLRVYGQPSVAGTVRITYQRRLPKLIASASVDQNVTASAVSGTNGTEFTLVAGVGATLTTNDRIDVIQSAYPYRYILQNAGITTANPTQVITNNITQPQVTQTPNYYLGYTLVKSGSSPYVHLPLEFKAALTHKIAASVLSEIGDMDGAQARESSAEFELGRVFDMLNPRSQSNRVKVVNPFSLMRRGLRGWR